MGWETDNEGNTVWVPDEAPAAGSLESRPSVPRPWLTSAGTSSPFDLDALSKQSGASVEASDRARLDEYQKSLAAGNTTQAQYDRYKADLEAQYALRGASTAHRTGDSQSLDRTKNYNPLLEAGAKPLPTLPGEVKGSLDYWKRRGIGPSAITSLGAMPAAGTPGAAGQGGVAFYEGQVEQSVLDDLKRRGIPYQIIPKSQGGPAGLNPGWTQDAQGNYSFAGTDAAKAAMFGNDPKAAGAYNFRQPTAPGATGPQFAGAGSPGKQFSDPITSAIEDYAARRAEERAAPSANSGQAQLEQALREISAQFRGGGFTPAEQQVFQTQALDPIEQMRAARKQQVMQQLSQRGIDPNSGVGMSMLADVDRQFDAMRQQTQRGLAAQSAEETTARMQQAIQMLTGLAGTENNRLNESYQYRQLPLQLADRAFNQASSLYNQTGNPMQGLQAAWLKYQNDENKANGLQELLGYLAGMPPQR